MDNDQEPSGVALAARRASSPYRLAPAVAAIGGSADDWMVLCQGVEIMRGEKSEMAEFYNRCVDIWLQSREAPARRSDRSC